MIRPCTDRTLDTASRALLLSIIAVSTSAAASVGGAPLRIDQREVDATDVSGGGGGWLAGASTGHRSATLGNDEGTNALGRIGLGLLIGAVGAVGGSALGLAAGAPFGNGAVVVAVTTLGAGLGAGAGVWLAASLFEDREVPSWPALTGGILGALVGLGVSASLLQSHQGPLPFDTLALMLLPLPVGAVLGALVASEVALPLLSVTLAVDGQGAALALRGRF